MTLVVAEPDRYLLNLITDLWWTNGEVIYLFSLFKWNFLVLISFRKNTMQICVLPESLLVWPQDHVESQIHYWANPETWQRRPFPVVWLCTCWRSHLCLLKRAVILTPVLVCESYHFKPNMTHKDRGEPTRRLRCRCLSGLSTLWCCRWPPRWPSATDPSASDAPQRSGRSCRRVWGRRSSAGFPRRTRSLPTSDTRNNTDFQSIVIRGIWTLNGYILVAGLIGLKIFGFLNCWSESNLIMLTSF